MSRVFEGVSMCSGRIDIYLSGYIVRCSYRHSYNVTYCLYLVISPIEGQVIHYVSI